MSRVTLEKLRKRIVKLEEDNKELNKGLDFLLNCLADKGIITVEKEKVNLKKDLKESEEPKSFIFKEINTADKDKLVKIITIVQESCVENDFKIDVRDYYTTIFGRILNDFEDLNDLKVEELREFASKAVRDLPVINSVLKTLAKIS